MGKNVFTCLFWDKSILSKGEEEMIELFFIWGEAHRLGVLKNPSDELVVTAVESLFLDLKKQENADNTKQKT